jgi:hypothetical protein
MLCGARVSVDDVSITARLPAQVGRDHHGQLHALSRAALITEAGEQAGQSLPNGFSANIRNLHTRRPMSGRAAGSSPGARTAA